ncbi:MAG: DNA pilot protein [Arizlama microvirus]|nr:MAG: DNA pilot protein [Arizlama microvirus]
MSSPGVIQQTDMLGAGVDLATTAVDIWSTSNQNKKQREWNEKQSKLKYAQDIEMWNKSNLYNSPASQMERYKKAGLNPNLMYGQGSPGLSSNTLPQYNKAEGEFELPTIKSSLLPTIGAYQDIQNTRQQRDNMKAQEEYIRTQNNLGLIAAMDNQAKYQSNAPWYSQMAEYNTNAKKAQADSAHWDSRSKMYNAVTNRYNWEAGLAPKNIITKDLQNKGLNLANQAKSQMLLNYSLDAAILKQKQDLNKMDIDIRKSIGGLKTTDITSGFSAMKNIGGLFKKSGSKIPKYSSLKK